MNFELGNGNDNWEMEIGNENGKWFWNGWFKMDMVLD